MEVDLGLICPVMRGNAGSWSRYFLNLMINALDAMLTGERWPVGATGRAACAEEGWCSSSGGGQRHGNYAAHVSFC